MNYNNSYDEFGALRVSIQPSILGNSVWLTSPNLCTLEEQWEIAPNSGRQLLITRTKLDFTKDVNFNQSAGFQILVNDIVVHNKIYNNLWDFIKESDNYQEFELFNRISWEYENALILKSSLNQKFKIILPEDGLEGTNCFLCLKCLSIMEN